MLKRSRSSELTKTGRAVLHRRLKKNSHIVDRISRDSREHHFPEKIPSVAMYFPLSLWYQLKRALAKPGFADGGIRRHSARALLSNHTPAKPKLAWEAR